MPDKKQLVQILQGMNETEICEIFYEAFRPRKIVRKEFGEVDDAYCIAIAGYSNFDGAHESYYWALPEEGLDAFPGDVHDRGATQSGQCEKCGVLITCISQSAICPICNTTVSCT